MKRRIPLIVLLIEIGSCAHGPLTTYPQTPAQVATHPEDRWVTVSEPGWFSVDVLGAVRQDVANVSPLRMAMTLKSINANDEHQGFIIYYGELRGRLEGSEREKLVREMHQAAVKPDKQYQLLEDRVVEGGFEILRDVPSRTDFNPSIFAMLTRMRVLLLGNRVYFLSHFTVKPPMASAPVDEAHFFDSFRHD
jgi:hypothetical protein